MVMPHVKVSIYASTHIYSKVISNMYVCVCNSTLNSLCLTLALRKNVHLTNKILYLSKFAYLCEKLYDYNVSPFATVTVEDLGGVNCS